MRQADGGLGPATGPHQQKLQAVPVQLDHERQADTIATVDTDAPQPDFASSRGQQGYFDVACVCLVVNDRGAYQGGRGGLVAGTACREGLRYALLRAPVKGKPVQTRALIIDTAVPEVEHELRHRRAIR